MLSPRYPEVFKSLVQNLEVPEMSREEKGYKPWSVQTGGCVHVCVCAGLGEAQDVGKPGSRLFSSSARQGGGAV